MSWRDKIAAVLAGKVGGPTPSGIHVYHSSPHDFDRFDLSKIGTGEGAQVYGHGIYAAENPKVSGQGGQYWEQFRGRLPPDEQSATKLLQQHGFDRAKAVEDAQKHIETMQRYIRDPANAGDALLPAYERGLPAYQRQLELLQSGAPIGPRTYEVNFNARPEQLLDWDKPMGAQSGSVIDAMRPPMQEGLERMAAAKQRILERGTSPVFQRPLTAARIEELQQPVPRFEDIPGERGYKMMGMPAKTQEEGYARSTEALRNAGVPGIRYLDEGSRISSPDQIKAIRENIAHREALLADRPGDPTNTKWLAEYRDMLHRAENPTHNYVAFDPSKLDIMAKYGVVGATGGVLGAGAMGGTIDQSSYGARQ